MKMFGHEDSLSDLGKRARLSEKLDVIHRAVRERFPCVDRIAVALYDPKTDWLKTFLASSGDGRVLSHYEAPLSEAASLRELAARGRPRLVDDLDVFAASSQEHTRRILSHGYGSSYTLPMLVNGAFSGVVFFDSCQKHAFTELALGELDFAAHLIIEVVMMDLAAARSLAAAVRTAAAFAHLRDLETGVHLDRVANYARLIARSLAGSMNIDDEWVEHIFLFASLHDLGKIGIPDRVLLKTGKLTDEEARAMRLHTLKGRDVIGVMLRNFGLEHMPYAEMLGNIAQYHHEAVDGSGYPEGLKGDAIPLEARITAVADVFDVLASRRSYKEPWSNDAAFSWLREHSGTRFDPRCVTALIANRARIEEIQRRFAEGPR